MNRREFLQVAVVYLGSTLVSCGSSSGSDAGESGNDAGPGGDGGANACTNSISAASVASLSGLSAGQSGIESTHSHAVSIPVSDILADVTVTFTHGVTGAHTHSLTLTPAQLTSLMNGQAVTTTTFNTGTDNTTHSHNVLLVCG